MITTSGSFRRVGTLHVHLRGDELPRHPSRDTGPPPPEPGRARLLGPGATGGLNSRAVLLIIAIVGTTVAPWQLFFQQSNIVDKRITPRWINYERADTVIGSVVVVVAAGALVITAAFAFMARPSRDTSSTPARSRTASTHCRRRHRHPVLPRAAQRLDHRCRCGHAVDLVRLRGHVRHPPFAASQLLESKPFYVIYTALVVCAAGIVLIRTLPSAF